MSSPSTQDVDIDVDVEERFRWLRAETLGVLLWAIGALSWLGIVPYLTHPNDFWPGWGTSLLLLGITFVCFALKDQSYSLASYIFVFGLTAFVGIRTISGDGTSDATPFLYVPVVLIAGTLQRTRVAVLVAILASITVLSGAKTTPASVDMTSVIQVLLAIWVTALVTWLTKRNILTTLHWYWHSQQDATRSLDEARRHRGELASTLKQLEDATYRLERLNYALNWARLDAEEARRMKAQFAAHVSHELRTPINLIVGFSDMMLNVPTAYGGDRLPIAYQSDIQALNRSATLLQEMIDDILDLSQLDAREMPLLREMVHVTTVVDEAVAAIRQLLNRKGLSIDVDVGPDVETAYLDPLRIRQVLLNLLSNASRHTSHGGISVRARRETDQVVVVVSDTGEGIAPHDLSHIFEAFHRLTPPNGLHEGWGLGLAICRQFVELHGGTITASSDGIPGRGTAFTISLPIGPRASPPPLGLPNAPLTIRRLNPVTPRPCVVVVDPDPHAVSILRRHLSEYQVLGVATREEAHCLARRVQAHAVLLNLPPAVLPSVESDRGLAFAEESGLRVIG